MRTDVCIQLVAGKGRKTIWPVFPIWDNKAGGGYPSPKKASEGCCPASAKSDAEHDQMEITQVLPLIPHGTNYISLSPTLLKNALFYMPSPCHPSPLPLPLSPCLQTPEDSSKPPWPSPSSSACTPYPMLSTAAYSPPSCPTAPVATCVHPLFPRALLTPLHRKSFASSRVAPPTRSAASAKR